MKFSTILSFATVAVSAMASPIFGGVAERADAGNIVTLLEGALSGIKEHTGAMNATMAKIDNGDVSKKDSQGELLDQVQGIKLDLSKLVNSLTTQAGIPVSEGQVDRVTTVLNALLAEVLFTVKSLVTILGLRPQLISLLHSVFSLLANLLTLVTGLLAGVLPGLIAGLSPLLAGLGNGLLAPLLTPIVALVAALAGP